MSQKLERFFKPPMSGKLRLFKMLEDVNSDITTAEFDTFPMNQDDVNRLEKIIRENTTLKVISLVDCNLSLEHLEVLAMAVLANKTLHMFKVELFYDCSDVVRDLMASVQSHLRNNMNLKRVSSQEEQGMKAIWV
ncbi:hypothetical protein [Legionella rowbothamii]|uniref:hypothetical protein n=1 Tax=Legionella rowbothamii TaxID=96229 RepID=UPI0010562B21|nr:hypothetical protein [Legionella rowbothamii]